MLWRHPAHPGRAVRLAYCLNLHPGETAAEVLERPWVKEVHGEDVSLVATGEAGGASSAPEPKKEEEGGGGLLGWMFGS